MLLQTDIFVLFWVLIKVNMIRSLGPVQNHWPLNFTHSSSTSTFHSLIFASSTLLLILMFLKWISYFKNITFVNLSFVSLFVLLQDYLMTLWIQIKYTDNSFDNAQLLVLLSNKKHIKKINGKTYCRHDVYIGLENHCWLWDTPLDGNS